MHFESTFERDYLSLVHQTITTGMQRNSRAGPVRSIFGRQLIINELTDNHFPIITTRRIYYKPVFGELAAFVRGATDLWIFKEFGCNYWDANAAAWEANRGKPIMEHSVGKIYGAKWRDFHGVDQYSRLLEGLRTEPFGRRHIITAWDPSEKEQCLPPCHIMMQFYVGPNRQLDVQVYQRSVDLCVGLPADIVLYAALLIDVADRTLYYPGRIIFNFGDVHVYENHVHDFHIQYVRRPKPLPTFRHKQSDLFKPSDLELIGYEYHTPIKYEFNV